MKNIYTLSVIILLFFVSCGDPQKNIAGNYTYETECVGAELDGSETIRSWGSGSNKKDAVEQAKKNGIRDILFKGIRKGKSDCDQKPVIFEVNAQEKYEEYFRKFFADSGPYSNFIKIKDEPKLVSDKKPGVSDVTYGVVITVLRSDLKSKLITDQIITQ